MRTTSKPFLRGSMTSRMTRSKFSPSAPSEPVFAVDGDAHVVALGLEVHLEPERDALVVLDDQDLAEVRSCRHRQSLRRRRGTTLSRRGARSEPCAASVGSTSENALPLPGVAHELDLPVVRPHHVLDDREARGPTLRARATADRRRDRTSGRSACAPWLGCRGRCRARVTRASLARLEPDLDARRIAAVLVGVGEQVQERVGHRAAIGVHEQRLGRQA